MKTNLFLAFLALSTASPAFAAAPMISGKYALSYVETCQATIAYAKSGSSVTSINEIHSGRTESELMLATFDAVHHKVSGSGFSEAGDLLILQNAGGNVVKESPWTLNGPYANTATQITVGGRTFRIVYATIVGGIARHADFTGISSPGCVAHGTVDRQ